MSPAARGDDKLIAVGAVPRADLLPPELKAEVKVRAQRRFMGFIVIVAVVVVVGAYLFATVQAAANALRLEASNATTQSLIEQKQQYIEVTEVQAQVGKAQAAQIVAVSTEINWKKYLQLVQLSLPSGTVISSATATTTVPGSAIEVPTEPLLSPSIASIDFVAITPTLPDVSLWIENLAKIPGFAGAQAGTITRRDDGQYNVTINMQVNDEALENRFIESDDDADDDDADDAEEATP